MNINIESFKFEHEKLYSNGILVEMILVNIIFNTIVTIGEVVIEGEFKFGCDSFNDNSTIEDYKCAIKSLFKGE